MLVDTHTNLMWYPEHFSDEFVRFALEAKRAKMRMTPDVYFAGSEQQQQNAFDSRPDQLLAATQECDRVVVFGIKARYSGIVADQPLIAEFVRNNQPKFIGWCSVEPNDPGCVEELEYYVTQLGFRGLKVSPIYQNWDPGDPRHIRLFRKAEELGIPVNIHQGTTFVRNAPLKYANPVLLEDIAVACPDLKMIIS
ncbi:MAG: amidohydrolase family protein, partial [Planctomycetaceae bacterium]|nr:amidohydrolase family protein [Planctomycetaceae bacterium]